MALPVPLVNPSDPGARILSASSFTEPSELIETLRSALDEPENSASVEIPLAIVRAQLDLGMIEDAREGLRTARHGCAAIGATAGTRALLICSLTSSRMRCPHLCLCSPCCPVSPRRSWRWRRPWS